MYSWIDEKKRGRMNVTPKRKQEVYEESQYEIRIRGHLDDRWTGWFEGLTLTLEQNGDTLISGQGIDQPALFGLLRKVRDTGMLLVSVNRITASRDNPSGDKS
jgi:hypothetical protein